MTSSPVELGKARDLPVLGFHQTPGSLTRSAPEKLLSGKESSLPVPLFFKGRTVKLAGSKINGLLVRKAMLKTLNCFVLCVS